jgi:hypothetical protein
MYSRESPSERYKELISQYEELHEEGETILRMSAEETFPGFSVLPHVDRIKRLIQSSETFTLLDYGCGKGYQYQKPVIDLGLAKKEMLADYWGLTAVQLYDPGYKPYSILPNMTFDGVISTDMLEHCSEDDVPWIVDEMFSFAEKFLFANVACYPAKKTLPNGENAHCTIKNNAWWIEVFKAAGERYPHVTWELVLGGIGESLSSGKVKLVETVVSSAEV